MKDDFSLGDLTDRITELEQEAANETADKKAQEDFVPKVLPPFPELRYLNLAHNQVGKWDFLVLVCVV